MKVALPVSTLLEYLDGKGTQEQQAELCGVDKRIVSRWHTGATVHLYEETADRIAVSLGETPWSIWGDEWLHTAMCVVCGDFRDSVTDHCEACRKERKKRNNAKASQRERDRRKAAKVS